MPVEHVDADVCIVGGGSAGLVLAAELAAAGREVLILERGPRRRSSRPSDHETFEWDGRSLPMSVRAHRIALGGDGRLWGGAAVEFDAGDFAPRAWRPGWPIGAAELDPYYERARRHLAVGSDRGSVDAGGGIAVKRIDRSPVRFGDAPPGVTVRLRTRVTRIVTRGSRVDHLAATGADGSELRVGARAVVLAAGGVEVPALLLMSGVGSAAVGRFFADHPYLTVPIVPPGGAPIDRRLDPEFMTPPHALLALSEAVRNEEDLPGAAAFLLPYRRPEVWDRPGVQAWQDLQWARRKDDPQPHPARLWGRALLGAGQTLRARWDLRTAWARPALRVVAEPIPVAESRVTLSGRTDRLGLPVPRVDWRLDGRERAAVERLIAGVTAVADRQGWGPVRPAQGVGWPERVESGHHHMGATRMADDPADGVVDRDCRVFGVDDLYVAGPSVFPSFGYANPMLTVVALAVRLADHLGAR